jgi:hypothetical protein
MDTTLAAEGLERAVASWRHVSSVPERYWGAFQKRCKAGKLPADPSGMSDHGVMDIGATRREIDDAACEPTRPRCSRGWSSRRTLIVLCNACMLLFTSEASAQCTARDVLQNRLMFKEASSVREPQIPVRSAIDVPAWKTITAETFPDSVALANAMGCGLGESAEKIIARPAFTLSETKTEVALFVVSAAELGFQTETASLEQIYARAQQLGFGLAAAEIAPQLRLQYLNRPIGEFLIMGMEPIKTSKGKPVILTVANGGAGLILIGQDGRANAEIPVRSRFMFVRPRTCGDRTPRSQIAKAVPAGQTLGAKSEGRFGKQDIAYLPKEDAYRSPAGEQLPYRYTNGRQDVAALTRSETVTIARVDDRSIPVSSSSPDKGTP